MSSFEWKTSKTNTDHGRTSMRMPISCTSELSYKPCVTRRESLRGLLSKYFGKWSVLNQLLNSMTET